MPEGPFLLSLSLRVAQLTIAACCSEVKGFTSRPQIERLPQTRPNDAKKEERRQRAANAWRRSLVRASDAARRGA
jgi:hypothetical protein